MALFSMFKPCRARTVRMSPLRCGRRKRTSPGRSATSRALKEIEKRVIRWMALFSMFKPCRARTVRMSPLRCGRRKRTSPGRSATSRAFNDTEKRHPMDGSFFYVRSLPGSNGSNVSAPVVAGERPPDVLRRLVLSMIQKRGIRWMALFCMFEPCRARTVRMSPLHCGRSNNFKCL